MTDCEKKDLDVDSKRVGFETSVNTKSLKKAGRIQLPEHTGIFKLHLEAKQQTLNCREDLREGVKLPLGVAEDDWIHAKIIGVYEELDMVISLVLDFCKEDTCTRMCAGKHTSYCWACEEQPTPLEMPAKQYMTTLSEYANKILRNQDYFPADGQKDQQDPKEFKSVVKKLLKRFFRVYAHTYLHHFEDIRDYDCVAHVNCSFKHFLYFVREFDLVTLDDMAPLRGLVSEFLKDGENRTDS
mmetsp:Transcript_22940/g.36671  ORF Transcript_22940/g.36671 Transcript_22940/m.36671 type:complete len:241 (-) Transcript_22940:96-818(-)